MSFRTDLQSQASAAFVDIASTGGAALGVTVTYIARGISIPNLATVPNKGPINSMRATLGTRAQEIRRDFSIPTQANFPPTGGIMVDDAVVSSDDGLTYIIRQWTCNDDIDAIFTVSTVCTQVKQVGAVGQ